jgi:hypothetical protein
MHFYGDIFRANFFDLKNSIIRQNNGDLEPLKGFVKILTGSVSYKYTCHCKGCTLYSTYICKSTTSSIYLQGASGIVARFVTQI